MTFIVTAPVPTEFYTLSLHDALPISLVASGAARRATYGSTHFACGHTPNAGRTARRRLPARTPASVTGTGFRSEEHTSELQSLTNLVCRLLLEKKKKKNTHIQVRHYI